MQEPRSNSTLELVVNEQQMQNMSQIDLSPSGATQQTEARLNNYLTQSTAAQQQETGGMFKFEELKTWPARFRASFGAKLEEAKTRSETRFDYVLEVSKAFYGVFKWILCFILTIILPLLLFFIALFHLDDCYDRPSLPYLVLAFGFFMTSSNLFNLALVLDLPILTNHRILSSDVKNIIASILNIIFNIVVLFIYIITAYMVFNMKGGGAEKSFTSGGESIEKALQPIDCNGTLYGSTFWFIALTLTSILVMSLIAALCYSYQRYRDAIVRGSTPRSQANNIPTGANGNLAAPPVQPAGGTTYSMAPGRV